MRPEFEVDAFSLRETSLCAERTSTGRGSSRGDRQEGLIYDVDDGGENGDERDNRGWGG
jgi:hypothetical protein